MRIAVCDDEKQELLHVSKLVDEYLSENTALDTNKVRAFQSSTELLAQIDGGARFDLYLLDIVLGEVNGIKLAAEIRKTDDVAKILFLTSSSEFAVESYSVGAFYYLIKPVQKETLFPVLKKACADFYKGPQESIVVKTQKGLCRIAFHELAYVEVIGRTLCFKRRDGSFERSFGTLSQIESVLLSDKRFIKPHRSYLVNMDCISSLSQQGILTTASDLHIAVSRRVFSEIKNSYIRYCIEKE